jgi:hypothetical protein
MTVQGHGWDDNVGYPAFRNIIINGGMSVAQRNTSASMDAGLTVKTADRWVQYFDSGGTGTMSVENDAPTGSGHRKSLKVLCNSIGTATGSTSNVIRQHIEGQNVQHFAKGTSSAKSFAVQFWIKSNKTGIYIAELVDNDNNRSVSAFYTINSSGTWEKKTIIFPADTTGVFDNDNNNSLIMQFWLVAGATVASGTLQTTWNTVPASGRATGQINLFDTINNYWQITGVQLEVGSVATPFEFEPFETTLRKCQRYYEKSYAYSTAPGTNQSSFPTIVVEVPFITSFGQADGWGGARTLFKVDKRASPTVAVYNESGTINTATQITGSTAVSLTNPLVYGNDKGFLVATGSLTAGVAVKMVYHYTANAEL